MSGGAEADAWEPEGVLPEESGPEQSDPEESGPERTAPGAPGAADTASRHPEAKRPEPGHPGPERSDPEDAEPGSAGARGGPRGEAAVPRGVHAGGGGAFADSVPAPAAGGLLIAGASGAAAHRPYRDRTARTDG
ncbi:hypothetical protein [Streptomyces viridosporus]|uniref:hypothetical protein n=1 Tax=Streptomyces viridosporus TaxID=67581 RepID=UPI0002FCA1A8|nr:hypothetical protein [Streptomyces viridosporus]